VSPFACLNSLSLTNPRTCFSPIYKLVAFQLISVVAGGSWPLNQDFDSNRIARIAAKFKFCFSQLYSVGSTDLVSEVWTPSVVPAPGR
jgi:hypothetical protein